MIEDLRKAINGEIRLDLKTLIFGLRSGNISVIYPHDKDKEYYIERFKETDYEFTKENFKIFLSEDGEILTTMYRQLNTLENYNEYFDDEMKDLNFIQKLNDFVKETGYLPPLSYPEHINGRDIIKDTLEYREDLENFFTHVYEDEKYNCVITHNRLLSEYNSEAYD
jgi:hypothetical protein